MFWTRENKTRLEMFEHITNPDRVSFNLSHPVDSFFYQIDISDVHVPEYSSTVHQAEDMRTHTIHFRYLYG